MAHKLKIGQIVETADAHPAPFQVGVVRRHDRFVHVVEVGFD